MALGGSLGRIQTGITTGGLSELGGGGIGGLENLAGGLTGQNQADAAKEAAEIQAQAQREQLAYLQEINAVPRAFLEAALQQYGGYYGIGFDPETGMTTQIEPTMPDQAERIALAEASPYYQQIMAGREAGEEAIARTASATGGLRGGGTTADIARFNTDLQNQALTTAYNEQLAQEQRNLQGLGTLMGQPTYGTQIGQTIGNIGTTQAQGEIAAAQAQSQAMGNLINLGGALGAAYISDERLKDNITTISKTSHPYIDRYVWDWKPEASKLGKSGREKGYIAQEVEVVYPDLVITGDDDYKRVLKEQLEKRLQELN